MATTFCFNSSITTVNVFMLISYFLSKGNYASKKNHTCIYSDILYLHPTQISKKIFRLISEMPSWVEFCIVFRVNDGKYQNIFPAPIFIYAPRCEFERDDEKKNTHLKTDIQIKELKILQNLHQSSQNPGRSFNVVNTGFHFSLAAGVCFRNAAKGSADYYSRIIEFLRLFLWLLLF